MGRCHGRSAFRAESTSASKYQKIQFSSNYETSFYTHYFRPSKIGSHGNSESLFAPRYSLACTTNKENGTTENWLGLNFVSAFDGKGLSVTNRPPLNIAIVLDISGSMRSNLGLHSKLSVAKENLLSVTSQLRDTDMMTFLVFNTESTIVQPLEKWGNVDKEEFKAKVMSLKSNGGTELSRALLSGAEILKSVELTEKRETRIMLLTDMEANREDDEAAFVNDVKCLSSDGIYTTIIGIGMDLARKTVQNTSKTAGCNYCNVRTVEHFQDLMQKEFNYFVTPIAFNVQMEVPNDCGWKITKGYGSPEISQIPLEEIKFSAIFPSSMDEAQTGLRSGCYLFKLERDSSTTTSDEMEAFEPVRVEISWEDGMGLRSTTEEVLPFDPPVCCNEGCSDPETLTNTNGLRKALLLKEYTEFAQRAIEQYNKAILKNGVLPSLSTLQAFGDYLEEQGEVLGISFQSEVAILQRITTHVKTVADARG